MKTDLLVVVLGVAAVILLYAVGKIYKLYRSKAWSKYVYVLSVILIGAPFAIFLKEGWPEKLGLDMTLGSALISGGVILYIAVKASKALHSND